LEPRWVKISMFRFTFKRFLLHLSSFSLALFIFYSVVFAANLLEIPFYLGYKKYIMNIVVLSATADRLIWALSIAVFSILFITQYFRKEFDGESSLLLSLFYGMLILMMIEAASFARWVYNLFFPSLVFGDESWHIAFTEAQITNILYPALPVILMFFSYSWIGEFTFKGVLAIEEENKKENMNNSLPFFKSSKISTIIIVFSVVAALFVGYYNFAVAGVYNPAFPGVDAPDYVRWLEYMENSTYTEAFSYASKNDRFLYLVLQYICFQFAGSSTEAFVAYFMPVVLTFLLMFSTFFLVRAGKSFLHASTAMLVTVFSFQVTVGLYAGFYANWFALFFVYVFYGFLMTVLKGKRRSPFLLMLTGLSSVAVLYVHPWTWVLLVMMILAAYIVTTMLIVLIRKADIHGYAWELKFLLVLLAVNVLMFYVKGILGVGSGAALVDGYVNTKKLEPSFLNAFRLRYFLDKTFNWYVGGFYGYPPMIILAILGVLSFLDYNDRYNRLLLNWMLVASAMVFVDFPWQSRFLYLTPFNVYVALGVLCGAEELSKFSEARGQKRIATLIFWIFYILSILFLLNYAVRCVAIKQFGSTGLTMTG